MGTGDLNHIQGMKEKGSLHSNYLNKWKTQSCLGRYCCQGRFHTMPRSRKEQTEQMLAASKQDLPQESRATPGIPSPFETRSQKIIRRLPSSPTQCRRGVLWHLYAIAGPHAQCGFPVTKTVYVAIYCSTGPLPLCVSPRFVCWSPLVPTVSHSDVCLVCTVCFHPPHGNSGFGEWQDLLQSSSVW